MDWIDRLLDRLESELPCGYYRGGAAASEPTALAAIALAGAERSHAAGRCLDWLSETQSADGSVGPTAADAWPGWPTALAILATISAESDDVRFRLPAAIKWLTEFRGEAIEPTPAMGHNSRLIGWPWVRGTHSWVEPTAWSVLALKAAGLAEHPRTREGVRLLIDRLLPDGGCNYGNTVVLGQELRPHLQPTGIALLALREEADDDRRMSRSLDYLAAELSPRTATASLSYGLLALAAHDRLPSESPTWLEFAYQRTISRDAAPYKLALLTLATQADRVPLSPNVATPTF